ncbi:MAG: hypothetical protein AB7D27_14745 [Desulfomicrobium sp.]
MENLCVSVVADDGGLLVTLPVLALAGRCARFRLPHGATYADLAREAERMVLEQWPEGVMYRLALPAGDCGEVHG